MNRTPQRCMRNLLSSSNDPCIRHTFRTLGKKWIPQGGGPPANQTRNNRTNPTRPKPNKGRTNAKKAFRKIGGTRRWQGFINMLRGVNQFPLTRVPHQQSGIPILQAHVVAPPQPTTSSAAIPILSCGYNTFLATYMPNSVGSYSDPPAEANSQDTAGGTTLYMCTTYSQAISAMTIAGSVQGQYAGFGASASASYADTLTITNTCVTVVCTGYNTSTQTITDASASTNLATLSTDGSFNSIMSQYGDSYVVSTTVGCQFIGTYVFQSTSVQQQTAITASLSASYSEGATSASANISDTMSNCAEENSCTMTYSSQQYGMSSPYTGTPPTNYDIGDASGAIEWASYAATTPGNFVVNQVVMGLESLPGFDGSSDGWLNVIANRTTAVGTATQANDTGAPMTIWEQAYTIQNAYNQNTLITLVYQTYNITYDTLPYNSANQAYTDLNNVIAVLTGISSNPTVLYTFDNSDYPTLTPGSTTAYVTIAPNLYAPSPGYEVPNATTGYGGNDLSQTSYVGSNNTAMAGVGYGRYFADAEPASVYNLQTITKIQTSYNTPNYNNSAYMLTMTSIGTNSATGQENYTPSLPYVITNGVPQSSTYTAPFTPAQYVNPYTYPNGNTTTYTTNYYPYMTNIYASTCNCQYWGMSIAAIQLYYRTPGTWDYSINGNAYYVGPTSGTYAMSYYAPYEYIGSKVASDYGYAALEQPLPNFPIDGYQQYSKHTVYTAAEFQYSYGVSLNYLGAPNTTSASSQGMLTNYAGGAGSGNCAYPVKNLTQAFGNNTTSNSPNLMLGQAGMQISWDTPANNNVFMGYSGFATSGFWYNPPMGGDTQITCLYPIIVNIPQSVGQYAPLVTGVPATVSNIGTLTYV